MIEKPFTTIIMPLHGGWKLTQAALRSIEEGTDFDTYRVILVDNASSDETTEAIRHLEEENPSRYSAVFLSKNKGFAGGVNAGLLHMLKTETKPSDYILIANNDILVPLGTIKRLTTFLQTSLLDLPNLGVVGPVSNMAGGKQMFQGQIVEGESVESLAGRVSSLYADLWEDTFAIVGLFFLMTREFFLSVGFFDERYFPGMWEESDYCLRGKLAGYSYAVDKSSFVWHAGNAAMKDMKLDVGEAFKNNRQKYLLKWHRAITEVGKETLRVNKETGVTDPQLPIRIALQKSFFS